MAGAQRRAAESPGETQPPWLLRPPTSRKRQPFWNGGRANPAIFPAPRSRIRWSGTRSPPYPRPLHDITDTTCQKIRKQNFRIHPGFGMVFTRSTHYSWERMGAMGCFEVG